MEQQPKAGTQKGRYPAKVKDARPQFHREDAPSNYLVSYSYDLAGHLITAAGQNLTER